MSSVNSWMLRRISGRVISEVCPGILAGKAMHSEITPHFLNMDMDLQTRDSPLSVQVFIRKLWLEVQHCVCPDIIYPLRFQHSLVLVKFMTLLPFLKKVK